MMLASNFVMLASNQTITHELRRRDGQKRTIGPAERVYQNGKLPPARAANSSAPPTSALLRPLGAARLISAPVRQLLSAQCSMSGARHACSNWLQVAQQHATTISTEL